MVFSEARLITPRDDFERAVAIFRRCRAVGVTPRGLLDCVVAAAQEADLPVLHHHRDLAHIATAIGLVQADGSLTA